MSAAVTRTTLDEGRIRFRFMCPSCGPRSIFDQIGRDDPKLYCHTVESAEASARRHAVRHSCPTPRDLLAVLGGDWS